LRDDKTSLRLRIVGTNELTYFSSKDTTFISNISPMGKALIGKEVGDDISVANHDYEIFKIE